MNAVMPIPSPQLPPYGNGLNPNESDALPPNYTANNTTNSTNSTNSTNTNNSNGGEDIGGANIAGIGEMSISNKKSPQMSPDHRRTSSGSSSSQQQQQQPKYLPQHQQLEPYPPSNNNNGYGNAGPTPFGLGPAPPMVEPNYHPVVSSDPSSYPWSIGSTDGSFALVHLQEQQHQLLQKQQQHKQQLQMQQQQQQPPSGGAEIEDTKSSENPASSNGSVGSASGEGSSPPMNAPPSPSAAQATIAQAAAVVHAGRSLYHDKLFHQSSSSVEGVLSASCEVMGFDIAEMWLRTGLKTHQLTNSHLRPTALQDSVRQELVEVYYGEKSNERTHRLSPALCKRAKDANDVVWVTAHTQTGAEALRMSISNVRTAVAVPICHEASNTNVTILYFSMRRVVVRPASVEFLIHMSLSAAVTSVNALALDGLLDPRAGVTTNDNAFGGSVHRLDSNNKQLSKTTSALTTERSGVIRNRAKNSKMISYQRADKMSITGARLDLQWRQLLNVEYLTDGGNSWIHTAVFDGKPVVVKTLRPECQDTALAINEIEAEVAVHSRLNHPNLVSLIGAGWTSKKVRFIVLERLDGGTLTQMLGYDTRIRDRRRRFWRKKQLPYLDVLRCARSLACALQYCNEQAVPGSMVLHRDLKPDNIGFTLDGQVKLLDFGLARILENSDSKSNDRYEMSGETGSLRYMAPEVAEGLPYNHKADVYSFGIILWEMNAGKRPFNGLSRETFYEQVVHGGERPPLSKKWPSELNKLISDCWNVDVDARPTFGEIVDVMENLLTNEKGGKGSKGGKALQRLSGIIDRHSTWF
jgi:serine/threonine protein kinase